MREKGRRLTSDDYLDGNEEAAMTAMKAMKMMMERSKGGWDGCSGRKRIKGRDSETERAGSQPEP